MKVTKAIIIVAGYGTRRLPLTKAVEKSMIPVGNRPVIDYIVDDCVKAGIRDIIFVVGESFEQLKTYFGTNELLEEYLETKSKTEQLQEVRDLATKAKFHYVIQDQHQPYGTATPLWLCRDLIQKDEAFLFISGDQFYFHEDGGSEAAHVLEKARQAGTETAMLAVEVPQEEVYRYGIVKSRRQGEIELYENIVEKPTVEEAPSNLNNGTFWLLTDKIFPYAQRYMQAKRDTEYYITDIANEFVADGNNMAVIRAKGVYSDCGNVEGWFAANQRVLKANP